jgi:hypothetical protein
MSIAFTFKKIQKMGMRMILQLSVCVCVRRSDFLTPQAATRFLKKRAMTARRIVENHTHINLTKLFGILIEKHSFSL